LGTRKYRRADGRFCEEAVIKHGFTKPQRHSPETIYLGQRVKEFV